MLRCDMPIRFALQVRNAHRAAAGFRPECWVAGVHACCTSARVKAVAALQAVAAPNRKRRLFRSRRTRPDYADRSDSRFPSARVGRNIWPLMCISDRHVQW